MHQMVLNSQKRSDQEVEKAHLKEQHQKDVARRMGRIATAMGVVLLVFLGLNMGLTAAVVYMSKETKVAASGIMTTNAGALVEVGQQRVVLPLSSMLYLPRIFRNQLEHLTVKLAGSAPWNQTMVWSAQGPGGTIAPIVRFEPVLLAARRRSETELDLKVQSTEFRPAPSAYNGVTRPATRRVTCEFDLTGIMYLSTPGAKAKLEAAHLSAAVSEAFLAPAVQPDGSTPTAAEPPHVEAAVEATDVGEPAPPEPPPKSGGAGRRLLAVHGGRRKLGHKAASGSTSTFVEVTGHLGQAYDVTAYITLTFSTLDRNLASSAGMADVLESPAFRTALFGALYKAGFNFVTDATSTHISRSSIEAQPQLTAVMQSGDVLQLIDAGHAKLIRPDGHIEKFCATCSQVSPQPSTL